jgi:malate dehydrogenase (oxaloacetate-decarboxylating)
VTAQTTSAARIELSPEEIFEAHEGGKLEIGLTAPLDDKRDLSIAYTPGVAEVSRAIRTEPELAKKYTWASRLVAVVSDGTAVLGLGNIGAAASLPVMEGKSALFKKFGGLDSIPLVLETTDVDEIVETLVRLRSSFWAVNLEDIAAPRCFELEARLIEALDMPVMHDDQHGTAVVVLAALTNAAAVVGRDLASLKVVISGAGAAGIAVAEILLAAGVRDVVLLDSRGIIHRNREDLTEVKAAYAARTNPRGVAGGLAEAMDGADVFIGVSSGTIGEETLATMSGDAIVFALSNPDPEVHPGCGRQIREGRGHRRHQDHPGNEGRRSPGHRRHCRRGPGRRLHHSQPARPARGPGGHRSSYRRGEDPQQLRGMSSQRPLSAGP